MSQTIVTGRHGRTAGVILSLLLLGSIAGCGGNSAIHSAPVTAAKSAATGRAVVSVRWPKPVPSSRLIPVDCNSIRVNMIGQDGVVAATQLLVRPTGGGTSTAEFDDLPVHSFNVTANAYPGANGTGVSQAGGSVMVTIVADQTTPFTLTLGTTITKVAVTPTPVPQIIVGQSVTVTATAYDADGNIVLTAGPEWNWSSGNTSIATVIGNGAQATVTGVSAGFAQVDVSDTESGVAAPSPPVDVVTGYAISTSAWPKFRAGAQNTGQGLGMGSVGVLKWANNTVYQVESSPCIGADGTVYIGTGGGNLCAFSPGGSVKWEYATGSAIASSPAVDLAGTIYVGSEDSYLYAVNADGSLRWRYKTGAEIYFSSPSIGTDGTIYIGSEDGYLYALNGDGSLKWKYLAGNIDSSPAIGADGTIYVGAASSLYAINPDGTLKWTYATQQAVQTAPAVGTDGTIYFNSYDGHVYALNPTGTLKWKASPGGDYSSPAIGADGTIYIDAYNGIYALNPDGTQKWTYPTGGMYISTSSPAVGADGTVYVGSYDSYLYALNANGTLRWKSPTGGGPGSPAIGADGTVYIGLGNGAVCAFQ